MVGCTARLQAGLSYAIIQINFQRHLRVVPRTIVYIADTKTGAFLLMVVADLNRIAKNVPNGLNRGVPNYLWKIGWPGCHRCQTIVGGFRQLP